MDKIRKKNNSSCSFHNRISKKLSSNILDFFAEKEIENLARESGFVSKESKLSGFKFLDLILFSKFDNEKLSLNDLSSQTAHKHQIFISKQAINDRFTIKSVRFIKLIIEKFIYNTIEVDDSIEFLNDFRRVRIKDSTCFQLPKNMRDKYAGSGGCSSKAAVRIQFEYDYKTGEVVVLSINQFNHQDNKDALESLENVKEKDLIIRDLGYISIKALRELDNLNASYLNRLNSTTYVFEKNENHQYVKLDFTKVKREMIKKGLTYLDKVVYMGAIEKYKVRLVIQDIPDNNINERIRKLKKESKKKNRKLKQSTIDRATLNLFITNIDQETLPASKLRPLYRLRWQIELMFKVWKSVGNIHKIKKMKVERFETILYAKLLWLIINWKLLWQIQIHLWKEKKILISFIKAHKTILDRIDHLRNIIIHRSKKLITFINDLYQMSPKNHQLEKKNISLVLLN